MGDTGGEWLICMTVYPLLRTPGPDMMCWMRWIGVFRAWFSLIQHAPHSPGSLLAYLGQDYISEVETP